METKDAMVSEINRKHYVEIKKIHIILAYT
jgi:hypothetical protein